ncbi:MAG TPA: DinB family protein [Candidatus Sulfotelmatobacter sp.]|nr:DinB family protein [Candidatus Sulfotelmatobacter sp.]
MPAARASARKPRPAIRRDRRPAPPRTEVRRLLDLFDRAWSGPAWHGPAVEEALAGVTAAEAAARPVPRAHTIGELVLHMATWKRAVASRLRGVPCAPSDRENFPPFEARDWKRARARLAAEHRSLRAAILELEPAGLAQPAVPGGSPRYLQAHGIAQHDLWHAGQIMILRRALERSRRG